MTTLYAPMLLLKEWAKIKLTSGCWKDALAAAVDVSKFLFLSAP